MKVEYDGIEYDNRFVGTVGINEGNVHRVFTDQKFPFRVILPLSKLNGAQPGDRVEMKAWKWTNQKRNLRAEVVQVFGAKGDEKAEQQAILGKYGIRSKWPSKVTQESKAISETISDEDLKNRFDFRDKLTITIDPDTAKDFDDAISLVQLNDREWELGVHIADVTHYLKKDSAMDKEAYRRGNSTYLVGRTVPMLPEKLSNGVCSLRPNEDKLTFSVMFHININGEVSHQFMQKGIINSDRRFTYVEAQKHITGEVQEDTYTDMIQTLNTIAKALRGSRMKQGGITFESTIRNIILNDAFEPVDIVTEEAHDAHNLIEEFMLLANRTVGKFIRTQRRPTVNRIHEKPGKDKLDDLKKFVKFFGYSINTQGDKSIRDSLNKLLRDVQGKPEANAIQHYVIRTMTKAKYDPEHIGHYGLGFDDYTHFTSPIRRYSDVIVHRVLNSILRGQKSPGEAKMDGMAKHVSATEISSVQAERESRKLKEAQYMKQFVGKAFKAVVVSIENFGVYVELVENGCRGLMHRNSLYQYGMKLESDKHRFKKGRKKYGLGDKIWVEVAEVDMDMKYINFDWFEEAWLEDGATEESSI